MARCWPLICALAADRNRSFRSYGNASKNNLVSFALILAIVSPPAAALLVLAIGLPMLMATQRHSAAESKARLALLPLARNEQRLVATAGFATEPLVWILLGLAFLGGWKVWPLLVGLLVVAFLGRALFLWQQQRREPQGRSLIRLPPPPGRFGPVLMSFIRPVLRTLDFYAALLLALAGVASRLAPGKTDPAAMTGISILVVVAFSTCAQTPFAEEGPEGLDRYRLLPLAGWKLLLLKDAAFLLVLLPLLLGLAPITGIAAALGALAAGHAAGARQFAQQPPWHFRVGGSYGVGLLQAALLLSLAGLAHRFGALALLPGTLALAASIAWHGRVLGTTPD